MVESIGPALMRGVGNFPGILIIALIILVIDLPYLYVIHPYYRQILPAMRLSIIPALVTYILLATGIYYFILDSEVPLRSAALLGLIVYGVYDMANMATISTWTLPLSLVDMAWGATLLSITTWIWMKYGTKLYRFQ
jgi:uncharacterized membrane protein